MAKKTRKNTVNVWHIATEQARADAEGIKWAHERCLQQIIGHFFSDDVRVEAVSVAVRESAAIVTMIGYKNFDRDELRKIHQADAEHARQRASIEG